MTFREALTTRLGIIKPSLQQVWCAVNNLGRSPKLPQLDLTLVVAMRCKFLTIQVLDFRRLHSPEAILTPGIE